MIDQLSIPTYESLRAAPMKPRVHGNGFLQLDLTQGVYGAMEGTRLHVWDDDLPRQSVRSSIHDHVFNMHSTVIVGCLIQYEYELDYVEDGEFDIWVARAQPNTNNTILEQDDWVSRVNLECIEKKFIFPYESYDFPAFELHDTGNVGTTATIMQKVERLYGDPRVLVPHGLEPDNGFDREAFDEEELWPFVKKALDIYQANLEG